MLKGTAGQVLINSVLPEEHQDPTRVLDKKGISILLGKLAETHPDDYARILHDLGTLGHRVAFHTGAMSFGLKHLRASMAGQNIKEEMERELEKIHSDRSIPLEERNQRAMVKALEYQDRLVKDVNDEAERHANPLALQVKSGARGNKLNVNGLLGFDLAYIDHKDNVGNVVVKNGYGKGLTDSEYAISLPGARSGVVSAQLAVADTGYFGKLLTQASHRLVVTAQDGPESEHPRGLPVQTDDQDNVGASLAQDTGNYKRNTVITPKLLSDLASKGHDRLLVRSPTVGGPVDGGVYGADVGVREKGRPAPVGDFVGITAGQALCLAEGTLVRMADGSVERIDSIVPGDEVLGCSLDGKLFPVRVLQRYDNGPRECVEFIFAGLREINDRPVWMTLDHEVLTASEMVPLRATRGRPIWRVRGGEVKETSNYSWENHVQVLPTYDLEVDYFDHLFVLANGLVVSNSEGITQGALGAKHSGGVAGSNKSMSGFPLLEKLVNIPRTFHGAATHARSDGTVGAIRPAPQGGNYVLIDGEQHHVPRDQEVTVKQGTPVEAGDVLSDGVPNPREIVHHKGIGEGRRYFTETFRDAMKRSGMTVDRRNVELIARGLIDHVELDEEDEDHVPGDTVPYQYLESHWTPREGSKSMPPGDAKGMYLESPALHYSVGTKIKPSVIDNLREFGVTKIQAHEKPPPFRPVMIRAMENLASDPDWMTRFLAGYVQKNFLKGVHRGQSSSETGTSYVASLARGETFNRTGPVQGWKPEPGATTPPPSVKAKRPALLEGLDTPPEDS